MPRPAHILGVTLPIRLSRASPRPMWSAGACSRSFFAGACPGRLARLTVAARTGKPVRQTAAASRRTPRRCALSTLTIGRSLPPSGTPGFIVVQTVHRSFVLNELDVILSGSHCRAENRESGRVR